jgi:nicotinate-nucleotide adenylyltransferase
MVKRIGFFGGSFNPAHVGHQASILHALTTANLNELIIAPVYKHPYGKELADFWIRMNMCSYLIKPFTRDYHVYPSTIEMEAWEAGGRGLTCNTIDLLIKKDYISNQQRPHVVIISGSDVRDDVPKWEGYDRLMELCKYGWASFFFIDRMPSLSSTAVRNAIKAGNFIDRWVPHDIHRLIVQNNLYK